MPSARMLVYVSLLKRSRLVALILSAVIELAPILSAFRTPVVIDPALILMMLTVAALIVPAVMSPKLADNADKLDILICVAVILFAAILSALSVPTVILFAFILSTTTLLASMNPAVIVPKFADKEAKLAT